MLPKTVTARAVVVVPGIPIKIVALTGLLLPIRFMAASELVPTNAPEVVNMTPHAAAPVGCAKLIACIPEAQNAMGVSGKVGKR